MSVCLVVEDSRLARKELVSILSDMGVFDEILEAENGEDAKVLLQKHGSVREAIAHFEK